MNQPRETRPLMRRMRLSRQAAVSLIATLVLIAAVAALYAWVAGQRIAVDFTLPQNFTLSPATQTVLDRLDRPVQLTAFYTSAALPKRDRDSSIFHLFETTAPDRFRVVYVDPSAQPILAERFGYTQDGSAFLTFADETTREPDLRLIVPVDTSGAQERVVANALLQLMAAGQFKVYFTTGHGEIDPNDNSADGLSFAYAGLSQAGIEVATLDALTLAGQGVPDDASALVIPGARTRFSQAEVDALARYMAGGGRLFVAGNAPVTAEETFLDQADPLTAYLRSAWGLRIEDVLVVDESASFQSATNVVPSDVVDTAITERVTDSEPVVFFGSRALSVLTGTSADLPGRVPILLTSDSAYGETDLTELWRSGIYARDAADLAGPLTLAALADDEASGARLLLTGDADFLRNEPIGYGGNRYFYTDGLAWLLDYYERVEIEAVSDLTRLPLAIPDSTLTALFVITVIVLPGLVLLAGGIVLARRRRK